MKRYGIVLEAVLILVLVGLFEYGTTLLITKYFSNESLFETALNLEILAGVSGSLIAVLTGLWLWEFRLEKPLYIPSKQLISLGLFMALLEFIISDFLNFIPLLDRLSQGKILFFDLGWPVFPSFYSSIYFIYIILLGPILEEVFFRGILFKKFKTVLPLWQSIVFSSVLFSLAHLNLEAFVYYFAGGCILSYIYHRTDSLLLIMAYHALFNLLSSAVKRREFDSGDSQFLLILLFFFANFAIFYLVLKRFHFLTTLETEGSNLLDPPECE